MDQLINSARPAVEWLGCFSVPLLLTSPPKRCSTGRPFLCAAGERSELRLLVMSGQTNVARGKFQGCRASHVRWNFWDWRPLTLARSSSLPGWQRRCFLPPARLEVSSLARQLAPLVFQPAGFSAISFPPCQTASAGFHSLQINRLPKGQIFR